MPPDGAAPSGVIAVLPRHGVAIAARMGLVGDSKNVSTFGRFGEITFALLESVYEIMLTQHVNCGR